MTMKLIWVKGREKQESGMVRCRVGYGVRGRPS